MPFADVNTLKVPEDLRDEQVLLLSDVIPTGWHVRNRNTVRLNTSHISSSVRPCLVSGSLHLRRGVSIC